LRRRAARWARAALAAGAEAAIVPARSTVGGGSLPGEELPTFACAVRLAHDSPDTLAARLRAGRPPVVARIERDRVLLDPRTVDPRDDRAVAAALSAALAPATAEG
ncbi:MAG: L-seryl-tRNA(Sec) selenium transferase, partial [Chloroflexi bacterium]|nr:L-seryl-tRNA(Sec) selenium transferase [Chloroflexota bacterium]